MHWLARLRHAEAYPCPLGLGSRPGTQIRAGHAVEVSGTAVIVDGDTLWVGSQEVRIHGIDAPETSQKCQLPKGTWDCSATAIAALASMTDGKAVRCIGNEVDRYGRLIAKCSTIGFPDIGARFVASGLAWAFIKYSTDYQTLEAGPAQGSSASGSRRHSRLGSTAPGAGIPRRRSRLRTVPSRAISTPRARGSITLHGQSIMLRPG